MEPEKRRKIIKYCIIVIVVLIVGYNVGWLIFHKPAYNGRVIDAETKEPIEGAVVVAIYQAYPIIGGPGGISAETIATKEALTDKNGEFHISSYTTILLPFWRRTYTEFIIYKPGYGSYPKHHVSPPRLGATREEFFLGELGAEGEFEWLSKKIKVTYGVVELPKFKTREERLKAWRLPPIGKPLPIVSKMIEEERERLFGPRRRRPK